MKLVSNKGYFQIEITHVFKATDFHSIEMYYSEWSLYQRMVSGVQKIHSASEFTEVHILDSMESQDCNLRK